MRSEFDADLKAERFYLLTGTVNCYSCRQPTPVSSILVEGYHEDDGEGGWEGYPERALLRYLERLDDASTATIIATAPWLRFGRSVSADTEYLGNHCQHCGALQGDWYLSEPGEIFFPTDKADIHPFVIYRFDQPLEARADTSLSSWLDELNLPEEA